jgi:putative Mn2+ efflux pump MntP
VSADALFVGVFLTAVKLCWRRYAFLLSVILMANSFLAYGVSYLINGINADILRYLVAAAFLCIGIKNFCGKANDRTEISLLRTIMLGCLMSVDVVVATVGLSVEYNCPVIAPVAVGLAHFAAIFAGGFLAYAAKFLNRCRRAISGMCLIIVAIVKIVL